MMCISLKVVGVVRWSGCRVYLFKWLVLLGVDVSCVYLLKWLVQFGGVSVLYIVFLLKRLV